MRGLTVILTREDPERLHAALSIAAAQAACGGSARIFCEGHAVTLLASDCAAPRDLIRREHGQPGLAELRREATSLGVELIACQAGMALAGLGIDALGEGVEPGGLVGLMANLGDDRLVTL